MHVAPQRVASGTRSQPRIPEAELNSQAIVASLVNFATPKRVCLSATRGNADAAESAVGSTTPLQHHNSQAKSQPQIVEKSAAASASASIKSVSQSQASVAFSKKTFTPKSVDKVNNAAKALEEEVFGAAVKLGFKNSEIQQMPKTADGMNVIFSFAFSKALPGNTGTLVQKLRLLNLHHLAADDLLAKRENRCKRCKPSSSEQSW
jgi:hypothetical protein